MKYNIVRHILLAKLTALALLTLCFVQPPGVAVAIENGADPMPSHAYDHRDGVSLCYLPSIGFVPGQKLRVTVAHFDEQTGQDQPPPDVRVGVWIFDSSGRAIAQSAQVQIPRNEFRSFDFNRAALNLPGEPGTGRLQVRAQLVAHVAEPYHFTADPKASSLLVPSMETIDNNTGRTRQIYNPYITVDFIDTSTGEAAARCGSCTNNLKQIGLAIHSHNDSGH